MKPAEKNVLLNSAMIRVVSALLTTVIHELGHFAVSIGLGNSATLHHNRVETNTETLDFFTQLAIPMGGPVVSLLQGILCMLIYRRIKSGPGSLLVLWLGISGLMAFFGYVMIAPFSAVGDTGKIFQLLEIPMWWQLFISIVSLILLTFLLIRFHLDFKRFVPENIDDGKPDRAKWARLLVMYPLLIGIFINTFMQYPVVHVLSLLPSLMMPFMLFMVYGRMIMSKTKVVKVLNKDVSRFSIPILILFIISIVIYRLLVAGLTI